MVLSAQDRWTLALQNPKRVGLPARPDEIMYRPTPKGAEFHELTIPNAILEGPRGTGKSVILRNDAHMHALRNPGMDYLIVRRTMPELRKSHLKFIDAEMKKLGGYFNKTESIAYYPEIDGKRSLGYYGYCENDADVMRYLSSQFARLYIDEITTFPPRMILLLATCVRVPEGSGFPEALRGGTNPLGESADFVKRWFIDKDVAPDEDGGDEYNPDDYIAVRMLRSDNPHMDWKKYDKRLSSLPEHVRRAWRDGEWLAEGAYFSDFQPRRAGEPWHVIDALPVVRGLPLLGQPWITIYRTLDFGFDPDPAVCLWIAVLPSGRAIVFKERTWFRTTAAEVAADIKRESQGLRIVETFCDPTLFVNSKATGSSVGDIFEQNGIPLTPSVNDRIAAGFAIHEWLNPIVEEVPKLQILRIDEHGQPACPKLIRTFPEIKMNQNDPQKIADGNDHYVLALAYFCMANATPGVEIAERVRKPWMRAQRGYRIGSRNVREMNP